MRALVKAFFSKRRILYIRELMARKKMTWLLNILNTEWGEEIIIDPIFDSICCTLTRCTAARLE